MSKIINRLKCLYKNHDWEYEGKEKGYYPKTIYKCQRCGIKDKV